MTDLHFLILFGLICMMCPCEGQINSPPKGKRLVFANGSTSRIEWSFDGTVDISTILRFWYFTNSTGPSKLIASIRDQSENSKQKIETGILPGVIAIDEPATLILEDVDRRYDGKYKFTIAGSSFGFSEVTVVIAVTPTVTFECSGPTTVDKGGNFTCICKGEGGNPPANVTWCDKDGVEFGEKGEEKQKLTLTNVDKAYSGNYTCKAFSHELAKSEKSIEIFVNFPPENVRVVFPTNMAERGKPYTITCTAEAYPPPTFKIFYNETKLLINKDTYTISKVNDSHSGFYHCVAKNTLGSSNSTLSHLRVGNAGQSPTTFGNETVETETSGSGGLSGGAIAGIVIGALVVVLVVIGVIYWFKFKPNGKDHGSKKDTEEKAKKKRGDENVYDAVNMDDKASGSRSSHELESPMNYAVLDKNALKTDAPKKPERNAEESTAYASIDVGKVGQVEADLV